MCQVHIVTIIIIVIIIIIIIIKTSYKLIKFELNNFFRIFFSFSLFSFKISVKLIMILKNRKLPRDFVNLRSLISNMPLLFFYDKY